MFRVSFLVKDKWLSDVLKAVDGKCGNLEVQTVSFKHEQKAVTRSGVGRPRGKFSPVVDQAFADLPEEFTFAVAQRAFQAAGCSKSSFWKRVRDGLDAGTIQKLGPGLYRKLKAA